jgi:protein arginine N-methyltransferase 1
MNPLLRKSLEVGSRIIRRLKERAGLVSGFSDMEMHLWILADGARAEAFDRAIRSAVRPGMVVADVGTGTGLLSMMACRAGAAKVYAVEEASVFDLARQIIEANGFSDRVVLIKGNSRKIKLPERVDLVISETIGTFVFSEGIVPILADARKRFLRPSGAMIPERIQVYAAPVESFREGTGFWEKPVCGFDYAAARPHVSVNTLVAARKITPEDLLDDERLLFDLEFGKIDAGMGFHRRVEFSARKAGTLHGFVGTWEARLHGDTLLRCAPGSPPLHWTPILFRLPEGIPVRAGSRISLEFGRRDAPGWQWTWRARVEPAPD